MGRGRGVCVVDYFKESMQSEGEMQADFQQTGSTDPGSTIPQKIVKGF